MSIKPIGILAATLAIAALAVPAEAMATLPVTLRSETLAIEKGETVTASSTNFKITERNAGVSFECAESEISGTVQENPGSVTETQVLYSESRFQGASKAMFCTTSEARYEVRIRPIKFRGGGKISFYEEEGNKTTGFSAGLVQFPIDIWDRAINKSAPIATCSYEGWMYTRYPFETPLESEAGVIVHGSAILQAGWTGACDESVKFTGTFAYTWNGFPVEIDP